MRTSRQLLLAIATLFAATTCVFAQQRAPRLPDSVKAELDIAYAETDNPRQRLDLLLPLQRKSEGKHPVIALIHGGAWRAGDQRGGLTQLAPFVEAGRYAGVSIGYRLSDEATWPAQIHDCKAAIRWLRANAEKYGLDPDRIGSSFANNANIVASHN